MNLQLQDQFFIVCGATSGFGEAIAHALLAEGAQVLAVARTAEKLEQLQQQYPSKLEYMVADITEPSSIQPLLALVGQRQIHGVLVNAGGPPAMTAVEATLSHWDEAYRSVLRWKIALVQAVLPSMQAAQYGRMVFIESASVKQPMENLVLSNAMRLAVVGYVKTLSQELANSGITFNVLAPANHATNAMNRLFKKRSEQSGMSIEDARQTYVQQTPVGFLGHAEDFASLAVWLLSDTSKFITGQTISVDGGVVKGTFS
ncbi:MAG TPA: SDR family oxidoreductase [Phnomibacter sp.]|nr:SDR family oxidoreductase [Phnomibacter sp.]